MYMKTEYKFEKDEMKYTESIRLDRLNAGTDIAIILKPRGEPPFALGEQRVKAILEIFNETELFEQFLENYQEFERTLPIKKKKNRSYEYKV